MTDEQFLDALRAWYFAIDRKIRFKIKDRSFNDLAIEFGIEKEHAEEVSEVFNFDILNARVYNN